MSRKTTVLLIFTAISLQVLFSCSKDPNSNKEVIVSRPDIPSVDPDDPGGEDIPVNPDAVEYSSLHDELADVGQFYIPDSKIEPEAYWTLTYTDYSFRRDPTRTGVDNGLQNYLLMESIAGLVNRACEEGKTKIGVWIEATGKAYDLEKEGLSQEIGRQSAIQLLTNSYSARDGLDVDVKHLIDGYVLTDLVNNPESGNVAAVASHVYNSIIVDVRDSAYFNSLGYEMKFDCSKMSVREAFDRFKGQCENDCLVISAVTYGELHEYAIKNNLFILNLNKKLSDPSGGQNVEVLEDALDWLKPNSQVLGWELGVGEDAFVDKVSEHGHMMLAANSSADHVLTSRHYKDRQPSTLVKTINPREIDYSGDTDKSFCSFFLTDGDNYQFIMGDNFDINYYSLSSAATTKMAFELGTESLIQLAPTRYRYLIEKQPSPECTIMETFGGGYYYIDTYSTTGTAAGKRAANLKILAERTAAHMRQHGIKVLHVMAKDLSSDNTKEALQAFVDANDQLEGITAVQYSSYDAGKGDIIWLTNKAGYDIPCICTKYMVWKDITTPASVVSDMSVNETTGSCCAVAIHCWSEFGSAKASDLALVCMNSLPENIKVVSMQELIWRVRMRYRREQTRAYLATIK